MFAERFDALMNIAEVSNSLLGRGVNMNSSHIGRLRSGTRPLPKKHEYLSAMCRYLAGHIRKDYQMNALQKLTGMENSALASPESMAMWLERWLLEAEPDSSASSIRLISGSSRSTAQKYAPYLYGNAGKRKAVEQFFSLILQEEEPQVLLLYSDENMAWLYEDAAFAARWAELFTEVIRKGNRVKIIHTVSRDMNEMLEAVSKWIPIYMTGMVEPYCYPRLRDGIFRRTLFIAPRTAAVVSSSVQENTDCMLNLFITDKAALDALGKEFGYYFSLCRPLMRILTGRDAESVQKNAEALAHAEGDAVLCSAMPPLFTMPEDLVHELSEQNGDAELAGRWEKSLAAFREMMENNSLTMVLSEPDRMQGKSDRLCPVTGKLFGAPAVSYTWEQYLRHIRQLSELKKQYDKLRVCFVSGLSDDTLLFIKENTEVIMTKNASPGTAFVIREKSMVSAFRDHIEKFVISKQNASAAEIA